MLGRTVSHTISLKTVRMGNISHSNTIELLEYVIKHLEGIKQEAEEAKDNPAYNKTIAVRLNIEAYIKYFETRK